MVDDEFEWDDAKAALNARNHGVSFEMAREVFGDVFAVAWVDNRHGDNEERFNMLGMAEKPIAACHLHTKERPDPYYFGTKGGTS